MVTAIEWDISGTYFESCNCDIACPCVFLSAPTTGECTVLIAWHIDSGSFAQTNLNDLNVALAAHSPGTMTDGEWKVALYIDERANQLQQEALTQIFSGQSGGHFSVLASFIGEVMGVSTATIDYKSEGRSRSLTIGNLAAMEVQAIEGGDGSEVIISNNPLGVVPGEPLVVARSRQLTYHDHGMDWELSGKNAYYSPFGYQGP
jgi:hypothetical protein